MPESDEFGMIKCHLINTLKLILNGTIDGLNSLEEWALTLDDWYLMIKLNHQHEMTTRQAACLAALDAYLNEISGEENGELWTMEAFEKSSEWCDVRTIVGMTIESFETKS